ncbi:MAG TPA: head-tail connector protein [Candidatus Dormibacteraeota bacterium]|nr:head-tail connector protein [Candidatus Dormibacteraeota bacterium]
MSVVLLADMKAHLRVDVDFTTDDVLIQDNIDAAEAWIAQFAGRALQAQTGTAYFDSFGGAHVGLELPVMGVQSIISVTYIDPTLTQQALAASSYVALPLNADDASTYIYPAFGTDWADTAPIKSAVTVTFQYGYAIVPTPFLAAIKLLAAHWYENREASVVGVTSAELPLGLMDLLTPYRVWSF